MKSENQINLLSELLDAFAKELFLRVKPWKIIRHMLNLLKHFVQDFVVVIFWFDVTQVRFDVLVNFF